MKFSFTLRISVSVWARPRWSRSSSPWRSPSLSIFFLSSSCRLRQVGVLERDVPLEALELGRELAAPLLDVGYLLVDAAELLLGVAQALPLEEGLVLELLEVALLARDLAAKQGEGLLGARRLGLHADAVAPLVLEGAAVLVDLLAEGLVVLLEGGDAAASIGDALVASADLAVYRALLRDDALGREELVDEGGRRLLVLLVAARELLDLGRRLGEVGGRLGDDARRGGRASRRRACRGPRGWRPCPRAWPAWPR